MLASQRLLGINRHPFGFMQRGLPMAHYVAGDRELLRCTWWYDWGLGHAGIGQRYDPSTGYVPMSKFSYSGPPVQTTGYVLYLNEPEIEFQSNISAQDAYDLLITLMEARPNMRFICGGGSDVNGPAWMENFHALIMANDIPADYPQFVGYHVHGYYAPSAGRTIETIRAYWETVKGYAAEFDGELWVTEFGSHLSNYDEQMYDLLKEIRPNRYAHFANRIYTGNEVPVIYQPETISLIDNDTGQLTARGSRYRMQFRSQSELTSLVNNGNFRVDQIWVNGTGWTISGGKAHHAVGSSTNIRQAADIHEGGIYRLVVTVSGRTAGTLTPSVGIITVANGTGITTNGTFTQDIRSGGINANLYLIAGAAWDGSIDDVKLYYIGDFTTAGFQNGDFATDSIWLKGSGWAIGSGKATKTPGVSTNIHQSCGLVSLTTYRLTFTVSGRTAGTLTPSLGSFTLANGTGVTTNATHVQDIECASQTDAVYFIAGSEFDGSIDDVTIVEL